MIGKVCNFRPEEVDPSRRRFIQPVAVALVFLLFAVLFFGMAVMYLQRLENLLMDTLKKKAIYVTEVIEKSAQSKYGRLTRDSDSYQPFYTGLAMDEDALVMQESLADALQVSAITNGCCAPTEGSLYPVLKEFMDAGLIEGASEFVAGRERKVYTLTPAGKQAYQVAAKAWGEAAAFIQSAIAPIQPDSP